MRNILVFSKPIHLSISSSSDTALLVRSSSDSFLPPPHQVRATPPPHSRSVGTPEPVRVYFRHQFQNQYCVLPTVTVRKHINWDVACWVFFFKRLCQMSSTKQKEKWRNVFIHFMSCVHLKIKRTLVFGPSRRLRLHFGSFSTAVLPFSTNMPPLERTLSGAFSFPRTEALCTNASEWGESQVQTVPRFAPAESNTAVTKHSTMTGAIFTVAKMSGSVAFK